MDHILPIQDSLSHCLKNTEELQATPKPVGNPRDDLKKTEKPRTQQQAQKPARVQMGERAQPGSTPPQVPEGGGREEKQTKTNKPNSVPGVCPSKTEF